MFLDDAKQVFILNFSIWRPESENREKIPSILILVIAIAYKFLVLETKVKLQQVVMAILGAIFLEYIQRMLPKLFLLSNVRIEINRCTRGDSTRR